MICCREIYSQAAEYDSELGRSRETFGVREVFINPKYIVLMKENELLSNKARAGNMLEGLSKHARFTQISLNTPGQSPQLLSVVGTPSEIHSAILTEEA